MLTGVFKILVKETKIKALIENIIFKYFKALSRELNSIGWTLRYICRGSGFERRSSHLSTLRVKFQATMLHDKKIFQGIYKQHSSFFERSLNSVKKKLLDVDVSKSKSVIKMFNQFF
jgi:hypothetical protein